MMGGEFCVNATRAFAALLAEEGKLSPESGGLGGDRERIRDAGTPARPRPASGRPPFRSAVLLDLPQAPPLENVAPGMYLVRVPGIAHLVLDAAAHPLPADKDRTLAALFARFGLLGEDAAGCIWLHREPSGLRITPFVWVRGPGRPTPRRPAFRDIGCVHRLPGRLQRRGELSLMQPAVSRCCRAGRIPPIPEVGPRGSAGLSGAIARGDVFVECLDGEGRTGGDPHPSSSQDF